MAKSLARGFVLLAMVVAAGCSPEAESEPTDDGSLETLSRKEFEAGTSISRLDTSSMGSGSFEALSREELESRLQHIEDYVKYLQHLEIQFSGVTLIQTPTDIWVLQELISEIKPDFVIETGTYQGGSSLFFAAILDLVNENGKVLTVDLNPRIEEVSSIDVFRRRVEVITGNSISPEVIKRIAAQVEGHTVFVTLDALHSRAHVAKELELYSPFVSVGSYIVVQDTFFEGPRQAIQEFLQQHDNFDIDLAPERKFLYSKFRSGFLKRVR